MKSEPPLNGRRLADVWAEAQACEAEALKLLTDHIRTMAAKQALTLVKTREVDDLVQDVVTSILGAVENLPCPTNLDGFIFYRARAMAKLIHKHRSLAPGPTEAVTPNTPALAHQEPWQKMSKQEDKAALQQCLEQLPEPLRTCLQRRYTNSETNREISRALELSHTTINDRLHGGLSALYSCLKGKGVMA